MIVWPLVKAHLVAVLPGIVGTGVTVYDGPVVTGQTPSAYLTVGDQPSVNSSGAGSFRQEVTELGGYTAAESGSVLCEMGAVTGSTSVPSIWESCAAITAYLHANQTLGGVLYAAGTVEFSGDPESEQTTSGAVQRLLFSVNYQTRI